MHSTEYTANNAFQATAKERARWAAVLAPTGRPARRTVRKSLFVRLFAFFA